VKSWPVVTLDDVFAIARGGSPRPIDAFLTEDPNGVNWIMIGDAVEGSKHISSTKKRIRPEGISRSRRVNHGDLLLTNSMSFGRSYILNTSGCIHDGWLVLSPRRDDVVPNFFYHLLGSRALYEEFSRLAAGAVVKNLNIEVVKGVRVNLPPASEQNRIAAILDKADGIRRKRKEAIALTEDLLRSTFLEMFGDPVTNPKGWKLVQLAEVSQVQGGLQVTHARANMPLKMPYLRVANVYRNRLDLREMKDIRLSEAEAARACLSTGDVLVVEGHGNPGELGRAAAWDGSIAPCTHQNHLIRVRANGEIILAEYLAACLNSAEGRRQMLALGKTTSGLNTISTNNVRSVVVALPPPAQQQRFTEVVALVRGAAAKLTVAAADCDTLFDSLVHRAFRGEL
jgi:type I restriction enzyme, S subunit